MRRCGSPTPGTARPSRASPGTPPWNGSGPGPRARSTACGAATPAPGRRPSCRVRRTPRCRSAWSPTRIRRRCRPGSAPMESPAVQAGKRAVERAFGTEALFTREGGSGPEAGLAEILAAPLVFIAAGLNSDRIHAPNEKVELGMLLKGAEAVAYLWQELALTAEVSPGAGTR